MALAPSLNNVSPTSIPSDNNSHTIQLSGNNFASGDTLTYEDPQGHVYANRAATFVSSSVLTDYSFNDASDPGTWYVEVNSSAGNSSFVSFSVAAAAASSYSISPQSPNVNESQGIETFTFTRLNTSQAETDVVSTNPINVANTNPVTGSGNYYYNDLNYHSVSFAAGVATATVQVTINDLGLASGSSENFGLILQHSSSGPTFASTNFTIVNNDPPAAALLSLVPETSSILPPPVNLTTLAPSAPISSTLGTVNSLGQAASDGTALLNYVATTFAPQ